MPASFHHQKLRSLDLPLIKLQSRGSEYQVKATIFPHPAS